MSSLSNKQPSIILSHHSHCHTFAYIIKYKITQNRTTFPIYILSNPNLYLRGANIPDWRFSHTNMKTDRIFYSNPIQIFILVLFHLFHLYFRYFTNIIVSIFYTCVVLGWYQLKEKRESDVACIDGYYTVTGNKIRSLRLITMFDFVCVCVCV